MAEPADKPGSVVDSHSSRRIVADTLKQPTRTRRGPRHEVPIWPCSRWGLPCRPVARLAVRSYRTISPLPDLRRAIGGIFLLHFPSARAAQALPGTVPCGARTFLGIRPTKLDRMTRLSGRLRRRQSTATRIRRLAVADVAPQHCQMAIQAMTSTSQADQPKSRNLRRNSSLWIKLEEFSEVRCKSLSGLMKLPCKVVDNPVYHS